MAAAIFAVLCLASCKGVPPYKEPKVKMELSTEMPVAEICARGLPVVFIDTPGDSAVTTKHRWMKHAKMTIVCPGDSAAGKPCSIWIKGHGNGTWRNYPKKPYSVKTCKPRSLLGMPEGYRYVFLANWRDRTLIRNAVALKISSLTSLDWTPEGRFVEVVMNGKMLGNYYMVEKPNVERNRKGECLHVPVGMTGHLISLDTGESSDKIDRTSVLGTPVTVKHPLGEDLAEGERERVFKTVDSLERMIVGDIPGDWKRMIDMESFCDWYIVQELTTNIEPGKPRSCLFHFTDDGVLRAGPCWDYDYKTFIRWKKVLLDKDAFWFKYMLEDEEFRDCLRSRWTVLEPSFRSEVPAFIDSVSTYISESEELNHRMWPIKFWFDNRDEKISCSAADEKLKKNYLRRISDLNELMLQ